jgi:hypothetical protein
MSEQCELCNCILNRNGGYGNPTPEGRSHASSHHYVAERFFGRSANRRGELRNPLPLSDVFKKHEGERLVLCYECHEELLHNPVFLPEDIKMFREIIMHRGFQEDSRSDDLSHLSNRISLLHQIIQEGLRAMRSRL